MTKPLPKQNRTRVKGRGKKSYSVWERRVRIAELYLEGKPQPQIAKMLGVNQATISRDLVAIREEWLKSSIRDFETQKSQEIAKIDRLEEQAWEAWHRSTKEQRTTTNKTESMRRTVQGGKRGAHKLVPTKVTENVTIKNCPGDPRFMETIAWCIETRLKILGAFKETTNINNLVIDWGKMVMNADSGPALEVDVIESKIEQAALPLPTPSINLTPEDQIEAEVIEYEYEYTKRDGTLKQDLILTNPDQEPLDTFNPELAEDEEFDEGDLSNPADGNSNEVDPSTQDIFPPEDLAGISLGDNIDGSKVKNVIGHFVEEVEADNLEEVEDNTEDTSDEESIKQILGLLQSSQNK